MTPAVTKLLIGGLLINNVAFGALGVVQTLRLSDQKAEYAKLEKKHADSVAESEKAARDAGQKYRDVERKWGLALSEVSENAQAEIETAQRDAIDARTAGERLRKQHAATLAALRSAATCAPADADSGKAADEAVNMLADMQRRLDEATDTIATFADTAYAASVAGWAAGEATR